MTAQEITGLAFIALLVAATFYFAGEIDKFFDTIDREP